MRTLLVILALTLAASAKDKPVDIHSGQALLDNCTVGHIGSFPYGVCMGVIYTVSQYEIASRRICVPHGDTIEIIELRTVEYLKTHAGELDRRDVVVAITALRHLYPCK